MMTQQHVEMEAGKNPEVTIESVGGALHLKGWERDIWRIDFPHDNDRFIQNKNKLAINAAGDCILRVPSETKLKIQSVGGDVHISGVEGAIELERSGGSAHIKRVGDIKLNSISGNLSARDVEGNLSASHVAGNAGARSVEGDIEIKQVGGNFTLRDAEASVKANVGGNATLRIDPPAKSVTHIIAGGHLTCRVESPVNAEVSLTSKNKSIFVQTEEGVQNLESRTHQFQLGKPSATIELSAGGSLSFNSRSDHGEFDFDFDVDFGEDFENMVEEISDQVSVQMEAQLEALNQQLESLSAQLEITGDRAVRSAQRKVEAAQRRLASKLRARGYRPGRRVQRHFAGGPAFEEAEAVSEKERMLVLEMVQKKKITVEEAEMLLATLEGREIPEKDEGEEKSKK